MINLENGKSWWKFNVVTNLRTFNSNRPFSVWNELIKRIRDRSKRWRRLIGFVLWVRVIRRHFLKPSWSRKFFKCIFPGTTAVRFGGKPFGLEIFRKLVRFGHRVRRWFFSAVVRGAPRGGPAEFRKVSYDIICKRMKTKFLQVNNLNFLSISWKAHYTILQSYY